MRRQCTICHNLLLACDTGAQLASLTGADRSNTCSADCIKDGLCTVCRPGDWSNQCRRLSAYYVDRLTASNLSLGSSCACCNIAGSPGVLREEAS